VPRIHCISRYLLPAFFANPRRSLPGDCRFISRIKTDFFGRDHASLRGRPPPTPFITSPSRTARATHSPFCLVPSDSLVSTYAIGAWTLLIARVHRCCAHVLLRLHLLCRSNTFQAGDCYRGCSFSSSRCLIYTKTLAGLTQSRAGATPANAHIRRCLSCLLSFNDTANSPSRRRHLPPFRCLDRPHNTRHASVARRVRSLHVMRFCGPG